MGFGDGSKHNGRSIYRHIQGSTEDNSYIGFIMYKAFYIGKCEIVVGLFINFVKATMMKSVIESKSQ